MKISRLFQLIDIMNVLFTADIHIKLNQKNIPNAWAIDRYLKLFNKYKDLTNKKDTDIFIIGGDIFDKMPSMEELELYYTLIDSIKCKSFIYSGNHEAVGKTSTFLSHLKVVTNKLNPFVTIIDDYYSFENIDFIPYNKLKEYHPSDIDFRGDILCTHVRGNIPPHVKSEVPLELFSRWKVVLAGDLHSYENSQLNIIYPGSPITTSFHRNPVKTGVLLLNTSTMSHTFIDLEMPQLIRKTIKTNEQMIKTEYDHTIYEIEGDIHSLSSVVSTDLLDKKIVKRASEEVSLILDNNMSIEEELKEYLLYILNVPETSITNIMSEFRNVR